ncbi:MAG: GAF domain-containing protein [Acetobacteraceae bacterium]|nr:GAF domain-containing protein [Acetobacteraceae bacterium]
MPPPPAEPRLRLHARILRDFGRIALVEGDVPALLRRAAVQAARATGVGHTKIMRYRVEHGDLLCEAGTGWRAGVVGLARFPTDPASAPGRAVQTGEPVLVQDLREHPDFRPHPVLVEHGIVALLNVPISFDGVTWGVLEADSEEPGHFDEADTDFLETLAALLAGALQHRAATERSEAEAAAEAVRAERRSILLRELQHRSKNNLAIVVAMLARARRQADREPNPAAAALLGAVTQRVAAIALAQDRLAVVEERGLAGAQATDAAGYLAALIGSLELSFAGRIVIQSALEPCDLPFEKAVALGLVVNELVTNAAKHAYPDQQEGPVRVTLQRDAALAEAVLRVADDGRGMDPTRAAAREATGGEGAGLLAQLARQLGGEVERDATPRGTSFSLRFPLAP